MISDLHAPSTEKVFTIRHLMFWYGRAWELRASTKTITLFPFHYRVLFSHVAPPSPPRYFNCVKEISAKTMQVESHIDDVSTLPAREHRINE